MIVGPKIMMFDLKSLFLVKNYDFGPTIVIFAYS